MVFLFLVKGEVFGSPQVSGRGKSFYQEGAPGFARGAPSHAGGPSSLFPLSSLIQENSEENEDPRPSRTDLLDYPESRATASAARYY